MNKFIFSIFLIGLVFLYSEGVQVQTTEIPVIDSTTTKPNKWKFGVGFDLSFVGGTNISLAPNISYQVSEKFSFGGGIQGSYTALKDIQNTTTIGGNLISQYTPVKIWTTLIEFAELNVSTEIETATGKVENEYWDSALFICAGINVTEKITNGAKYNVLYKEDESVYTSPVLPFVNISV